MAEEVEPGSLGDVREQASLASPATREPILRPGTPDAGADHFASPSASERQCTASSAEAAGEAQASGCCSADAAPSDSHDSSQLQQQDGPEAPLQCSTCKVTATSEQQLATHLEGKKHRRFVAMAELDGRDAASPTADEVGDGDLRCDLCDVSVPTPHHKEYHLRGQKHQRRSKQQQLMDASAQLATSAVDVLLAEAEAEEAEGIANTSAGTAAVVAAAEGEEGALEALEAPVPAMLRSPFEAFEPSQPTSEPCSPLPPLRSSLGSKTVRFSGQLELMSRPPDAGSEAGPPQPLPPGPLPAGSFHLMSGGSFSSPAAHFCPVCGIIATSEANLQDHLRGRRHARRLQYLSHMPEAERQDTLQRTMTQGSSHFWRQGSLVLPSSMDLTQYLGRAVLLQQGSLTATPDRLPPHKSFSSQQLSSCGSVLELPGPVAGTAAAAGGSEAGSSGSGSDKAAAEAGESPSGEGPEERGPPKPQPRCEVCGITTTSAAHMEAHVAGRKHRRRIEASLGRGQAKQSPHYCPLCDISTTSAAHLALHLVGRAHRRRERAVEDGDAPHLLPARAVAAQQAVAEAARQATEAGGASAQAARSSGDSSSTRLSDGASAASHDLDGSGKPAQRRERRPPLAENRRSPQPWNGGYAGVGFAGPLPPHGMPAKGPMPPQAGFFPYQPGFFPGGHLPPQMLPQGPHPGMFGWWGPMPGQGMPGGALPGYHPKGPFPPMQPPHFVPGAPPFGLMPQGHPARPAWPGGPPSRQDSWGPLPPPGQPAYACEVCNVEAGGLDEYKTHLRGKQHMRRLHSQADRAGSK